MSEGSLGHSERNYAYFFSGSSICFKFHYTVAQREEAVVLGHADVFAGKNLCSPLPDNYAARRYLLAAESFDAESLRIAVAAVPGTSAAFLVCHEILLSYFPLVGFLNRVDVYRCEFFAVALRDLEVLSLNLAEHEYFVIPIVIDDRSFDDRSLDDRVSDRFRCLVFDQENLVKSELVADLGLQLRDGHVRILGNFELFSGYFYDS